jgi:hypothetical protein
MVRKHRIANGDGRRHWIVRSINSASTYESYHSALEELRRLSEGM